MNTKRMVSFGLAAAMALTLAMPNVNVNAAAKQAKKITFASKKITVTVGQKKKMRKELKVKPKVALKKALKNIKWKSSKKKVVKINKKGVITALKPGKSVITARRIGFCRRDVFSR